ncbi:MAG TPA: GNAT family N-acetyltransferase [Actinomycetota bacterium]
MNEDEFQIYVEVLKAEYADEVARNDRVSDEAARAHAERSTADALPHGVHSDGQRLLIAEDADGDRVGQVWLAHKPETDRVYIFDIEVAEAVRGKGYGRRLMELIEGEARTLGVSRIELNVYADNEVARHLYETTGYLETSRHMVKLLD